MIVIAVVIIIEIVIVLVQVIVIVIVILLVLIIIVIVILLLERLARHGYCTRVNAEYASTQFCFRAQLVYRSQVS